MPLKSAKADTSSLAARLGRELEGEVLFDAFSRGRYSTDASVYQIQPIGVVVPRTRQDVLAAIQIAAEHGVPILPRGAGTSQCGQTVGEALVIDASKFLREVRSFQPSARTISVDPGIVLDELNRFLRPHGLFFPVDVSTSSRATIGGMAGNNSVGARSLHYGHMVDNVIGIQAVVADGEVLDCRPQRAAPPDSHSGNGHARQDSRDGDGSGSGRLGLLTDRMRRLYASNAEEIDRRFPKVARNVAGYNINRLGREDLNLAELLVGSEGTLAWFQELELTLQPIPAQKVLGICHFPTFRAAMESVQHIIRLDPAATELIDRTVLELAAEIPAFSSTLRTFIRGSPVAVLLVEFAGDDLREQLRNLDRLEALMGDLGLPGSVLRAESPALQARVWSLRKASLNIVMSMKGDGKPISFVEDCAVPLENLADYTRRLTDVFSRHGTTGTWYAHAGAGCLHVRPILNLKQESDIANWRSIAAEAHAMVREYKGTHSGEHGDGLVRSEFLEPILGTKIVSAFREVKDSFDPDGRFNPGKIIDPPRMDERSILRFSDRYQPLQPKEALDWSAWGGFHRATEMCNNNGACRKATGGVMCPSFRVTQDEKHVTRGRANSLRLALTGQLPAGALTSKELYETMDLCVGCKACKRECPTGVDVYRMKIEFLSAYRKRRGLPWRDRIIAYLPRYAPWAARFAPLANTVNLGPAGRFLRTSLLGFTAERPLPAWRRLVFRGADGSAREGPEVVLLVDTFNTYFEPETASAALNVLTAAGYRVVTPRPVRGGRPLCCGRTFLNAGLVDEAITEARRVIETLRPYVERGVPVVGLEPSCLLTLRDEFAAMMPGDETAELADRAMLFEEFLAAEHRAGRLKLPLKALAQERLLLHGHCHQKAFDQVSSIEEVLRLIPGTEVELIASGCCGMAGSFGYEAEHYETSMKMAELDLLPQVRKANSNTLIVADGTSCRTQIKHGSGRDALHVARVLDLALHRG
ncbi:MAG: FAD-binding protein [Rhodospirillaceae bacterium]|nr:FAD-binding protein [Rhodospirillaceae bacterium]